MAGKHKRKISLGLIPGRIPVPRGSRVSLPFGVPGPYIAGVHTGTDYAVPVGTEVYAVRNGRVVESRYDAQYYGNFIVIEWFTGTKRYLTAHMSRRSVQVGDTVKRGQVIGYSGDTGNATGPHVHAEQRHAPFGYRDFEKPFWA